MRPKQTLNEMIAEYLRDRVSDLHGHMAFIRERARADDPMADDYCERLFIEAEYVTSLLEELERRPPEQSH
jgi:hypothetical protein